MNILKTLQKKITSYHVIALLGLIVLVLAFKQYSENKTLTLDGMTENNTEQEHVMPETNTLAPANPAGENEIFSHVSGIKTSNQDINTLGNAGSSTRPEDLLPNDTNSDWARLNPTSNNDLSQVNLLKAGYHNGIDTVGNSLRNANLQLRSEPANPTNNVSPWMNTTIGPDLTRRPLE